MDLISFEMPQMDPLIDQRNPFLVRPSQPPDLFGLTANQYVHKRNHVWHYVDLLLFLKIYDVLDDHVPNERLFLDSQLSYIT